MPSVAATIFLIFLGFAVLFQFALALGMPWGSLAMGGRFPGKFPPPMRVAAIVQGLVLMFLGLIVLVRDGFMLSNFYETSTTAIWVVVAIFTLSLIMNLATTSKWERIIWAPTVGLILICSLMVALS